MKFEMKQGRYKDVTSAQYHGIKKCVGSTGIEHTPASKSTLTKFIEDPETWKRGITFNTSKSMDMGSLVDAMCLEPQLLKTEFIRRPETYIHPKEGEKKWSGNAAICKKWIADNVGTKTVIDKKMWEQAKIAQDSLMNNAYTRAAIEQSDTQVAYVVDHNGVYSKSLFDMAPREGSIFEDSIVDMKRTIGFTPQAFKWEILKYKYHWQAAMYLDAHNKVT